MEISAIPSLQDNYSHIISDGGGSAVVVDPGDDAALRALQARQLRPAAVLLTHRHADHVDGLPALLAAHPDTPVYAPAECALESAHCCADGESLSLLDGALTLRVLATPGHTLGHVAYIGAGVVLSGDTLFIGGCGRVFEGSMRQMHDSLAALAALPDETLIYCGHEYTAANLRFAAAVEPGNAAVQQRLGEVEQQRKEGKATVPGALSAERQTNPFLRLAEESVIRAASDYSGAPLADSVAVFTALREWKNNF